jgi:hypothetical protein
VRELPAIALEFSGVLFIFDGGKEGLGIAIVLNVCLGSHIRFEATVSVEITSSEVI